MQVMYTEAEEEGAEFEQQAVDGFEQSNIDFDAEVEAEAMAIF